MLEGIGSIKEYTIDTNLVSTNQLQNENIQTSDAAFEQVMQSVKDLMIKTQEAEDYTTQLTYDFITGKDDNIHNLMIAQEKSSLLLQYTMHIRNGLLDAYNEIMRIPV